jgi:hypothetical protein
VPDETKTRGDGLLAALRRRLHPESPEFAGARAAEALRGALDLRHAAAEARSRNAERQEALWRMRFYNTCAQYFENRGLLVRLSRDPESPAAELARLMARDHELMTAAISAARQTDSSCDPPPDFGDWRLAGFGPDQLLSEGQRFRVLAEQAVAEAGALERDG